MLLLNRYFWSYKCICQESPPPVFAPTPSGRRIFVVVFRLSFLYELSRQPHITVRANYTQNKCHEWEDFCFCFFFSSSPHSHTHLCNCHTERLSLPLLRGRFFRTVQVLNVAEVRKGACGEMCAYAVPAGRNIETAQPCHHHHQSSSHFTPKRLSFCLLLSFPLLPAFTSSFVWQQKHHDLRSPRWPNYLGVSESVGCFELNFNV